MDPEKAPIKREKDTFGEALAELAPTLRKFAQSICKDPVRAEDLAQETMTKALENRGQFIPGTSMRRWTFTILRNQYYSELRKDKRMVEDVDGKIAAFVAQEGSQNAVIDLKDLQKAFAQLTPEHQEILVLIAVHQLSYKEISDILEIEIGTVKSRANRARTVLRELMGEA